MFRKDRSSVADEVHFEDEQQIDGIIAILERFNSPDGLEGITQ